MGDFRGLKRDVWEGGHHVPFVVRWPGHVKAGSVSDEVITQVDIMATLAEILQIELPEGAAPDSHDFLPVLKGEKYDSPIREATVHNTFNSKWGLRKGKWLYIDNPSGEHSKMPESFKELRGYVDFETEGILFDMGKDPGQRENLFEQHPEVAGEMEAILQGYRDQACGENCYPNH
jgi:arylsulfatase A-like enzyme